MTSVAPPPPPAPAPLPPPPLPVVVAITPPASLLKAALGAKLEALVLAPPDKGAEKGQVQIQTPQGNFAIQTPLALPKGSVLTLTLLGFGPPLQLQINSIDGRAPHPAFTHPAQASQAGTPNPMARPGAPLPQPAAAGPGGIPFVSLTGGSMVSATLLRPALGGPAALSPLPLPQAAPPLAGGILATIKSGWQSLIGQPARPTPAPAAPPVPTPLAAGTRLDLRIISVQAPSSAPSPQGQAQTTQATAQPQAPNAPRPIAAGAVLSGGVTSITPTGQPVVTTPSAVLALETRASVPVGARLVLEVRAPPSPPSATVADPAALAALRAAPLTQKTWPALEEALRVLDDARAGGQIVTSQIISLPRFDATLASGIIFFLAVLKGGDFKAWLGDSAIRILDRQRPGLVGRLEKDFEARVKMADEPLSGDWRAAVIPLQTESGISQIRLYTQRPDDEDPDGSGKGTRFVVEVELSLLGRMQLDGLLRDDGKRLDLIVRSAQPLTEETRNGIRHIFHEAAELTGIRGGVVFQANPPAFVELVPVPPADRRPGVIA